MNWSKERMEKELKKFDPMLRVRKSVANSGLLLIERKCSRESACLTKPLDQRGIDRYIQDRDGYIGVLKVPAHEFGKDVFLYLRERDMWDKGGSSQFVDELEAAEALTHKTKMKDEQEYIGCLAEEGYDKEMIKQGDVVSGFRSKVGGYEPSTTQD